MLIQILTPDKPDLLFSCRLEPLVIPQAVVLLALNRELPASGTL